jgi:4a-hydroxytetrahydrobiopterin dehydratase
MDMLTVEQIAAADLADWRKMGQGLHARYLTGDFAAGAAFVAAIGAAGGPSGHHPRATIGAGYVDLAVISDDAVYRDSKGVEHIVEWVTERDLDLARRITGIAADRGITADPSAITVVELALDTAHVAAVAPVWAALLTGSTDAQGRGMVGDDVRDATGRVPILWFQDTDEHETPRQRFHIDVWVAPEVAGERIAAAIKAGGILVDDSQAPSFTVIADRDGNKACVCTALPPAVKGS